MEVLPTLHFPALINRKSSPVPGLRGLSAPDAPWKMHPRRKTLPRTAAAPRRPHKFCSTSCRVQQHKYTTYWLA
jgi:hypothetical protein